MSNVVYPALPGLTYNVVKRPTFSTRVQQATSGAELRAAFWTLPIWHYQLAYEFLRTGDTYTELQTLLGFFLARQGQFDSFLFDDPDDDTVTQMPFGTGNGSLTSWQIYRTWGGFSEPVYNFNGTPQIYVGGVLQSSGYTLTSSGLLTFTTAPANGATIAWSGRYYWPVRFDVDALEASKFMATLWEAKTVKLVGVR